MDRKRVEIAGLIRRLAREQTLEGHGPAEIPDIKFTATISQESVLVLDQSNKREDARSTRREEECSNGFGHKLYNYKM